MPFSTDAESIRKRPRCSRTWRKNLAAPKSRGMTTTLVTTSGREDHREAHDRAISQAADVADFVTDDLSEFLARVNAQLSVDKDGGAAG